MSSGIQPKNRYALKEWAVVVKALASGRQILLLRKGGIMEDQGGFTVEHTQFFLYPTYVHEQAERILPETAEGLNEILREKPEENRVLFDAYGVVEEAFLVNEIKQMRHLRPYHILADHEIESRFYYRDRPGLYVVLLRMYRMNTPIELTVTKEYAGCKSWVDLGVDLPTAGCRPVFSDEAFEARIQTIRSSLNKAIAKQSKTR